MAAGKITVLHVRGARIDVLLSDAEAGDLKRAFTSGSTGVFVLAKAGGAIARSCVVEVRASSIDAVEW